MTIHIPRWLAIVLGAGLVVAAVVTAFIIGRSSDDDMSAPVDSSTARSSNHETAPVAAEGKCSDAAAEKATLETDFADRVRDAQILNAQLAGAAPPAEIPFFDDLAGYRIAVRECADLTGDGVDEMVVALSAGASGRIYQWAIFSPNETGQWQLAFDREGTQASDFKIRGDRVIVRVPTYADGEPACCPSGSKTLEFQYRDGAFKLVSPPPVAPKERLIIASDDGVTALGQFDPLTGSPIEAFGAFGTPTSVIGIDELCTHEWSDIGLRIDFVNLGGADPCGPDGAVGSFEVYGPPAAQAGWLTDQHLAIGDTLRQARAAYPGGDQEGSQLVLIEIPSPFGGEGATQRILTAYTARGRVTAFQSYVGAGGE